MSQVKIGLKSPSHAAFLHLVRHLTAPPQCAKNARAEAKTSGGIHKMSDQTSTGAGKRFLGVRNPRDFWGGLVLLVVAVVALWATKDLSGMQGFAFGPGTAPRLFSALLAICGAGIALIGLFTDGPDIEPYAYRGPALVVAAILIFALIVRPVGLVPASYLAFLIAIAGSREAKVVESLIAAAAMTAFCVALFYYGLGLPFQLWPRF
jgi:putative tricarboxylic transport membrane protein